MKLSDIMSAADMTSWAEWGLLISFFTFLGIVAYVFIVRRGKENWEQERSLPLDDEYTVSADISAQTPTGEQQ